MKDDTQLGDAQIYLRQRIAADPTSPVLLLAAPSAAEMWPGLTLTSTAVDEQLRVAVRLPADVAAAGALPVALTGVVHAAPPRRTPTAYVLHFTFDATGLASTSGTLTLSYEPGESEHVTETMAHLAFGLPAPFATARSSAAISSAARRFLATLAAAAEARSRAA